MPQSNITVICSGNVRKGFFACFFIINHDISVAAEQNEKGGEGGAENKIGNSNFFKNMSCKALF